MSVRLLVTGATGLVGRYVVAKAAARGYDVHAVTSNPGHAGGPHAGRVTWHLADLVASRQAAAVVRKVQPTHIIHSAWDTRHSVYWNSPANLSWLSATAEMAQAFAEAGGARFVLVGTCAEYDWSHGYMIEGVTPEKPSTLYGWCKLAAHNALQGAAAKLGFTAATARIFFAYGPHENANRFIPYICRTLAKGETPRLSGGRQLRDLLHARDTAAALIAVAEDARLGGAVNIGSGEPVSLGQVAGLLAEAAGGAVGLGLLPDRADDPLVLLPSVDRLFSTGWRPQVKLREGMRETYDWWAAEKASAGDEM